MTTEYLSVGKLRKPHGIHGAFGFLLTHELKNNNNYPSHFFLEKNSSFLPFFIEDFELIDWQSGYIQFEEIKNPEEAKKWSTSDLYLTAADLKKFFKKTVNDLDFLIGFSAITPENIFIGTINSIDEMPGQTMLVLENEGNEILIPLVEDWIADLNKKTKKITLTLPEGFLHL